MQQVLNWAIVGCNVISDSHLAAVAALPNARVYAVCDIVEERARKKAQEYGADKVYTDYRALMEDPAVDVVSICTPSGLHGEIAVAAAEHHKHILCEKPLEITGEKMTQMIQAAERNQVKLGCVYQRRTYPENQVVHDFIRTHDLGPVIYAEARIKYFRDQAYYDSGGWRATWDMDGGGALMNQGVHGIDLLLWFMGEPKSVSAICKTQAHAIPVEDAAAAIVEFKNGAIGVIRGGTCMYPPESTCITLHFKTGTITVSDGAAPTCRFQDPSIRLPEVKTFREIVDGQAEKHTALSHRAQVADLAEAILTDRAPAITPADARRAVDLILAIYRASEAKKRIALTDDR